MRVVPLLLALVSTLALSALAARQQPDFTGRWLRNPEMSQFWREKYDATPRRATNKWERENVRRLSERIEQQLALAEQIALRQTARDISFDIAGRGLRIFYFDRDHIRQTPWGEEVETSTNWEGDELVIVEKTESGSTVIERLTILGEDQIAHLFIWEDSDLFEEPLSVRSVYDRASD